MQNVKIKEIADELGIRPKEVLQKAIMMSINVKSIKSSVSVEDATKIFDTILHGSSVDVCNDVGSTLFHSSPNLKIYTTNQSSDIDFLKTVSKEIMSQDIDNSLIFSYNYDDEVLQTIYANVDESVDIEKYLAKQLGNSESNKLSKSIKSIAEDFNIEFIDNDPLKDLKAHIQKYKPQLVSIEGVNLQYLTLNNYEVVHIIKNALLFGVKFNISLKEISDTKSEALQQIVRILE